MLELQNLLKKMFLFELTSEKNISGCNYAHTSAYKPLLEIMYNTMDSSLE